MTDVKDWALSWDDEAGFVLTMPRAPDEDEELPREVQVLVALFRRTDDPEFVQEQLDWLRDQNLRFGFR